MRRFWLWFRRWRHDHGHHRLCHEIDQRVRVGTDFSQTWLVGRKNPDGSVDHVDATVFGGTPIYETRKGHG